MNVLSTLKTVWFSLLHFLDYPDFFVFRRVNKQVLIWDIHCATVNHWNISIHNCTAFLKAVHPRSFSAFRFITPELPLLIHFQEEKEELERQGFLYFGQMDDLLQQLYYQVKRDPKTLQYIFRVVQFELKPPIYDSKRRARRIARRRHII